MFPILYLKLKPFGTRIEATSTFWWNMVICEVCQPKLNFDCLPGTFSFEIRKLMVRPNLPFGRRQFFTRTETKPSYLRIRIRATPTRFWWGVSSSNVKTCCLKTFVSHLFERLRLPHFATGLVIFLITRLPKVHCITAANFVSKEDTIWFFRLKTLFLGLHRVWKTFPHKICSRSHAPWKWVIVLSHANDIGNVGILITAGHHICAWPFFV